jgi:uncharacterized protein YndB with AHSA1/START domain
MATLLLGLERLLPAPPPAVFAAFTEPDKLVKWWGPHGVTTRCLEWDPRPGAPYRLEMQPPDVDAFYLAGEFREVDPATRLSMTFEWEPPDPEDIETIATLSFRAVNGSTQVDFIQGPFKTEARLDVHRHGWGDSLDRLAALL